MQKGVVFTSIRRLKPQQKRKGNTQKEEDQVSELSEIPEGVLAGFAGKGRSRRWFQIRDSSKGYGDGRVQVMRDSLWFSGLTEVKRNVGMMVLAQKEDFGYHHEGLLSLPLILGNTRKAWKGEKQGVSGCDEHA